MLRNYYTQTLENIWFYSQRTREEKSFPKTTRVVPGRLTCALIVVDDLKVFQVFQDFCEP